MSFPRYERYKDSGMEWVGNLPSSWSINKIKFNTYVKGRVGWHGLNSNEFSDVGIHLITGTDFENGFVGINATGFQNSAISRTLIFS